MAPGHPTITQSVISKAQDRRVNKGQNRRTA